jgi:hypothetical protein
LVTLPQPALPITLGTRAQVSRLAHYTAAANRAASLQVPAFSRRVEAK